MYYKIHSESYWAISVPIRLITRPSCTSAASSSLVSIIIISSVAITFALPDFTDHHTFSVQHTTYRFFCIFDLKVDGLHWCFDVSVRRNCIAKIWSLTPSSLIKFIHLFIHVVAACYRKKSCPTPVNIDDIVRLHYSEHFECVMNN